jgi:hypothetical protein
MGGYAATFMLRRRGILLTLTGWLSIDHHEWLQELRTGKVPAA